VFFQATENMHRQIGKLSRKQSNFNLAERLLAHNSTHSTVGRSANAQEHAQWMEFEGVKLGHSQACNSGGDVVPILLNLLDLSQRSSGIFLFAPCILMLLILLISYFYFYF
jgi:hypothetical protein